MTGFAGVVRDIELVSSRDMLDSLFPIDPDDEEASDRRDDEFYFEVKKPWGGTDHPQWEQVVIKQQEVLDGIVAATLHDQWYWPVVKQYESRGRIIFWIKPSFST